MLKDSRTAEREKSIPSPLNWDSAMTRDRFVTLALVAVLACISTIFYYEYSTLTTANNQLTTEYNQSQQSENGIPRATASSCFSTNAENDRPGNPDFYHQLPKTLENATIAAFGLETYWPSKVNDTDFRLYEVWNVTLIVSSPPPSYVNIPMFYTVDCSLTV